MTRLPIIVLVLAWSLPASAYTIMKSQTTGTELKWTSLPMKFNIHLAPAKGITAAQTQAAVRAAYKTWADVSCSYFSTQDLGVVNMPTPNGDDYINTHVWRATWPADFGSNALGITQTKYDPYSGKILDADVNYNPGYTWSVSGSAWDVDVQSVATHEIGHEMGLDHSQYQDATMFYATGVGDTSNRSLHSDDIAAICYVYPSGSPPPPECSLPEHCAPSETCQNGKCVAAAAQGYGSPCITGKECESQLCLSDGSNSFCSVMCDASKPCPNGDQCVPLQNGGSACLPGSATWSTKELGQPCQSSQDCKDNRYCISVPGKGYLCASFCDLSKNDCPSGFTCTNSSIGGLCIPSAPPPPPPPPPPPKNKLGETCTASVDCESGVCAQTNDGLVCVQWCDDAGPCPIGFKCVPAGAKKVCVRDSTTPPPPAPGELGADCADHSDCKSGICGAADDGRRFCTELCDPAKGCAEGYDCVPAGADKYACSPATNNLDDGGGGCAVAAPEACGPRWPLLLLALPFFFLLRRRR